MEKKKLIFYTTSIIIILMLVTIGATYAYLSATTGSANNSVQTQSTIYKINMNILPIYNDFSWIPMNDQDAIKAIRNQCRDKYERGVCSAYKIRVFYYDQNLDFISGLMDVTTNNMVNLSYMMLQNQSEYVEERCVKIEDKNYCIVKEATPILEGNNLSLGDSYDVTGTTETEFILLMWLTNLNESQNEYDVGSFNAVVTMQAGSGGEIKGSIASAIQINQDVEGE